MSMEFPETFDPSTEEGNTWELLPVGEWVAQAIEGAVAPPQSGDGYALTLTWKILEGDHEGRQVWQHVTYLHSNAQAQAIGRKTIKDICTALGINDAVLDASVFLFKPARIRVGIQKDKNGIYPDRNKISRILPFAASAALVDQPLPPKATGGSTDAKPPEAPAKPAPAPAPRTQGMPRSGPSGSAPWHNQR